MLFELSAPMRYARLVWKFRGYKPKRITIRGLRDWISQFEKRDRPTALNVLERVEYLTENDVKRTLVEQNETLLKKLEMDGIPSKKIIYISIDKAGSSSSVILNILRDACNLERRGCHLLDSRDVLGIIQESGEINQGAIIYVDDFSASGGQFCTSRDFVSENLIGTFAEFFLVTCICEEAIYELAKRQVEARTGHVHAKAARPLHDQGTILRPADKERMREICFSADKRGGLGFGSLATNVVFYRNSPNTVPVLLRGNKGQDKLIGIVPRTDDLPVVKGAGVI